MRPQTQRYLFGHPTEFGDCHRTCIAMILNMDRDDVPHFMSDLPPGTPADDPRQKQCEEREIAWLAERGLASVTWGYTGDTNLGDILDLCRRLAHAPVILGCSSTNGNHSVVIHKGEIVNPHGDGIIVGPMADGNWYLTAICPGPNWRPRWRDRLPRWLQPARLLARR